jgi:hypothetical protein
MGVETAFAHYRFGIGARPGDAAPTDARQYLSEQLRRFDPAPESLAGQPGRAALAAEFREYQLDRRERRAEMRDAAAMADEGAQIDPARLETVVNTLRQHYVRRSRRESMRR